MGRLMIGAGLGVAFFGGLTLGQRRAHSRYLAGYANARAHFSRVRASQLAGV